MTDALSSRGHDVVHAVKSARNDDLCINAYYAAECVALLFELLKEQTSDTQACGMFHREAVRGQQLAYKLMVCGETLQRLGRGARMKSQDISMDARTVIDGLNTESCAIYGAIYNAARTTKIDSKARDSWTWLRSIEHQDWLRSHLACIESLARVLSLALRGSILPANPCLELSVGFERQKELHNLQLAAAIKRLVLTCETCRLNVNMLERAYERIHDDPWRLEPWKSLVTKFDASSTGDPIDEWISSLVARCGTSKTTKLEIHDSEVGLNRLVAALSSRGDTANVLEDSRHRRRRSSVRWPDDHGGRLERGSSLLNFNTSDQKGKSILTSQLQILDTGARGRSPAGRRESEPVGQDKLTATDTSMLLTCGHDDCRSYALQPPLFADKGSLAKHMKLVHDFVTVYRCTLDECKGSNDVEFTSLEYLKRHQRNFHGVESTKDLRRPSITIDHLDSPPRRPLTPAIEIPQRERRRYSYTSTSPHLRSPRSPMDDFKFSPPSPTSEQNHFLAATLQNVLDRKLKPAFKDFLVKYNKERYPQRSRQSAADHVAALTECDRLVEIIRAEIIKPTDRLAPLTDRKGITSVQMLDVVEDALKIQDSLDRWRVEAVKSAGQKSDIEERRAGPLDRRRSERTQRDRAFFSTPSRSDLGQWFGQSY